MHTSQTKPTYQVGVPSRTEVPEYQRLAERVNELVRCFYKELLSWWCGDAVLRCLGLCRLTRCVARPTHPHMHNHIHTTTGGADQRDVWEPGVRARALHQSEHHPGGAAGVHPLYLFYFILFTHPFVVPQRPKRTKEAMHSPFSQTQTHTRTWHEMKRNEPNNDRSWWRFTTWRTSAS